jgi:hypothetical protein
MYLAGELGMEKGINSPDIVVSGKVLGHGNIQTIKL